MRQDCISEKRKELVMLVLLLIFSSYFLFYKLPGEMGDDAVSWSNSAMWINKAHESGRPVLEILDGAINSPAGRTAFSVDAFYITGLATPLWTVVLAAAQKIAGNSAFWTLFLSAFFGLLTVLAVYFTGREFYSKEVGFLSGIILSSMLLFALISRSGSGFYTLQTFFFVLTVFFFLSAHRDKKFVYLLLSGISTAFLFFNGYPTGYTILPILLLYLIVISTKSFKKNTFRFGIKEYLAAGSVFISVFIALAVLWSLYANLAPLNVLDAIASTRAAYQNQYFSPNTLEIKLKTILNFFMTVFIQTPVIESLRGTHIQLNIIRHPIISPLISVFFITGLYCITRRRNPADILFIVWSGLSLIIFTVFLKSYPRTLFFVLPAISIIAANGIVYIVKWFDRFRNDKKILKSYVSIFLVMGLALNAYYIQHDMFTYVYGTMGGNINRFYGMSAVATYINQNGEPEKTEVVLGDSILTPYDAFYFYTYGKPYPVLYWWDDLLYKELGGRGDAVNKLYAWETQVLSEKEKIYYLFAVGGKYNEIPGWNLWQQVEWGEFKELHPDLQPVKRIFFPNGIPALELYEVNRTTQPNNHITLDVQDNSEFSIQSASDGYVKFIKIKGAASNLSILDENQSMVIPMNILPGMEVSITHDENSRILFEPLFLSENYRNEIYMEEKIYLKENAGWLGLNDTSGDLMYKIEAPYRIEKLSIRSNPRVFNDKRKRNSVSMYYSMDGKNFQKVYEVRSDGTGNWTVYSDPITGAAFNDGIYERESYNIIYPQNRIVYILFRLEGAAGEAQLWSANEEHSLMFDAEMDTSFAPKLKLKKGLNRFKVHAENSTAVKLTIATDTGILLK